MTRKSFLGLKNSLLKKEIMVLYVSYDCRLRRIASLRRISGFAVNIRKGEDYGQTEKAGNHCEVRVI